MLGYRGFLLTQNSSFFGDQYGPFSLSLHSIKVVSSPPHDTRALEEGGRFVHGRGRWDSLMRTLKVRGTTHSRRRSAEYSFVYLRLDCPGGEYWYLFSWYFVIPSPFYRTEYHSSGRPTAEYQACRFELPVIQSRFHMYLKFHALENPCDGEVRSR